MAVTVASDTTHNRVALVEDHLRLAGLVTRGLQSAGIAVDHYRSLEATCHALRDRRYAVVIVDRGLPDGDGLELVRRLRAGGDQTPCLMLTARDALRDRVDGLDAGADDYLAKPFALDELAARVRALMRRTPQLQRSQPVFGDLAVEPHHSVMRCGGQTAALSSSELQIIIALVRAGGRTVRRDTLELAAWGVSEAVTPNALDVAIHRLRKKLTALRSCVSVSNMRSQGFSLSMPDAPA
ncbi:response regulator transcription factor [Xanthomonas sp. AM6]|uniref:response regulator transcription factor n=1 Tax=Xanthomonas sp. AM6 TaxID=2982531 RepID=UPI0021D9AD14|nr:response regulator transcription factor [Xanthomonas sp. AM6]UYB54218.1 response regulator transcription factor [Xanthomonas sp. AM6]